LSLRRVLLAQWRAPRLIVSPQSVSSDHQSAARMLRSASGSRLGMEPPETIYIEGMVAACNGGGGPLGHPRVYLNLAPGGRAECPYCSRLFVNRAGAAGEVSPPQSGQERRSV
jgi:uncharacterized Zn-finger protein